MKKNLSIILFVLCALPVFSQKTQNAINKDSISESDYHYIALKPTKATFYSAILPGLGQAYNKDYWKIPIVYTALGIGIYSYDFNNDRYHKYREAYKLKKLGLENDYPGISESTLERAQKYHKKYRDLSLLVTSGLYVLQIVEASVDAHLQYHNTESNLTLKPIVIQQPENGKLAVGMGLRIAF